MRGDAAPFGSLGMSQSRLGPCGAPGRLKSACAARHVPTGRTLSRPNLRPCGTTVDGREHMHRRLHLLTSTPFGRGVPPCAPTSAPGNRHGPFRTSEILDSLIWGSGCSFRDFEATRTLNRTSTKAYQGVILNLQPNGSKGEWEADTTHL